MASEVQKLNLLLSLKYIDDCKHGGEQASAVVERMRREENPLILSTAIRNMIAGDEDKGVKIGFLHEICERILHSY